jgi:hypothetical protein
VLLGRLGAIVAGIPFTRRAEHHLAALTGARVTEHSGPRTSNGWLGAAIGAWLALAAFAALDGIFWQRVLEPNLGEEIAHFISTTSLAGAVIVAGVLFVGLRRRLPQRRGLFTVGLILCTATILFEVMLAAISGPASAPELLGRYDPFRALVLLLIILAEVGAPVLAGRLRERAEPG